MAGTIKIRKLFFATRFHDMALNRLKSLFPLAAAGLEEIVLCHIIPREDVGFVPFGGYLKEEEQRFKNDALIRFEDWQAAITAAGLKCKTVVEVGETAPAIISALGREDADLLVIGRKKAGITMQGSNTLELLRRSPVATLVFSHPDEGQPEGQAIFGLPLLATDFSRASDNALSFLLSLTGTVRRAAVVHIIAERESGKYAELKEKMVQELGKFELALKQAGMETEHHIGAGERPWEAILEKAAEINASMIIAATTHKDRLHEFFLGSVSHRLAEHSRLPVLLIPD